jgi:hypothetical protein
MANSAAAGPRKASWSWQLKIELLDVKPSVWRRLLVPETIMLPTLHEVLQATLGWTNSHLHEFVINGVRYSDPDPDEHGVALQEALGMDARCFDYVYDFGDDWHHVVLVEDQHIAPTTSIRCTGGENACPPEDVGGALRYATFMAAISDPNHEEHETYQEWSGGGFDPARFDLAAANRALDKIKVL